MLKLFGVGPNPASSLCLLYKVLAIAQFIKETLATKRAYAFKLK
jgi:hypothetical protein